MSEIKAEKHKLEIFGRNLVLMLNRASMYTVGHPYVKQAIEVTYDATTSVLESVSPLVFIMTQEKFFIDEEPLDPRVNTSRLVNHFKKKGIQSISFEKGLEKRELRSFVEIYSTPDKYPDAEAIKKGLTSRRIYHLKINHVFYKKVTADDEVIPKEALRKITPDMMEDAQLKSKKMFMDALLESVLTEEFLRTLNINNLIKDPKAFSKQMIEADLESANKGGGTGGGGTGPGPVLLQQLELIGEEVERNLSEATGLDLPELANAVFEMKKQLMETIEEQKVVGMAFSNEEIIKEKANEITDRVLLKLVKEEYGKGSVSIPRLAHIVKRLVPEPEELKRLLPQIKATLIEEGMALEEYLRFLQELSKELRSEELAKILGESSEEIGIDSEQLIEEVKRNPTHAAELIYLAAELRKGGGDEKVLTDLLVDYIERLGSKITSDMTDEQGPQGEQHLRRVMTEVRSKILERLQEKDLKDDVLARLEERLNQRVDEVLDKLRLEWLKAQPVSSESSKQEQMSVLETLEQSVGEDQELAEILKVVRSKVEAEEIDENDFAQIHNEIEREKKRREQKESKKDLPAGILDEDELMIFLEKEIARVTRYNTPSSALAFTVVKAKPRVQASPSLISRQAVLDEILHQLAKAFRATDLVGQIGKNKIVALLPMTPLPDAKLALRRVTRMLHSRPIQVNGVRVDVRIAGVASDIGEQEKPDLKTFLETFFNKLADMATRIRNIHAYL